MKLKTILRSVSFFMLIIAIAFLIFALSHPQLGSVFYIGDLAIGSDIWRAFYAVYATIAVALFGVSFLVKDKKRANW